MEKHNTVIGFTGTQQDITTEQIGMLNYYLSKFSVIEVHHGDCTGADAVFHNLSLAHNIPVILHPPIKDNKRAFCSGYKESYPKKDYLERNRDIVDACDLLIATPKGYKEELRSGTWSTIRYAKRLKKRRIIIYPDGSTKID